MVTSTSPRSFLVLGHQGFIGSQIKLYLDEARKETLTISERLHSSNVESLLASKVTDNTVVINCIGSGVTPGTGDYAMNYQANYELVQKLGYYSLTLGAQGFIHFASNYELPKHIQPLASRKPYVLTKSKGSEFCLQQIQVGNNVRLSYLPTVIGLNQPQGRFFKDFITHLQQERPFQLKYPTTEIKIVTIPSLFRQLDLLNSSMTWGVQEILEDLRISVLGFAEMLNDVLEELGEKRLILRDANGADTSNLSYNSKVPPYEIKSFFVKELSKALRGFNR